METISKEKYVEIFHNLPENVQDALLSIETADIIHEVGNENGLSNDLVSVLTGLVGDLLMGVVNEAEFRKLIKESVTANEDSSNSIADELVLKVVAPLKVMEGAGSNVTENSTLESTEKVSENLEGDVDARVPLKPWFAKDESLAPPVMPQKQQEHPTPKAEEEPAHEAPLILHKEEEVEPAKENQSYSTQRPAFYKPTFSEEYKRTMEAGSAARVELGEESRKAEPQTGRTPGGPSRIVHYSEFRTPLSPFEGAPSVEPQSETPRDMPAEVHPNNIVDLKDLPLK